jgi:hypothetical protein
MLLLHHLMKGYNNQGSSEDGGEDGGRCQIRLLTSAISLCFILHPSLRQASSPLAVRDTNPFLGVKRFD